MPKIILRFSRDDYQLARDTIETSSLNTPVIE